MSVKIPYRYMYVTVDFAVILQDYLIVTGTMLQLIAQASVKQLIYSPTSIVVALDRRCS